MTARGRRDRLVELAEEHPQLRHLDRIRVLDLKTPKLRALSARLDVDQRAGTELALVFGEAKVVKVASVQAAVSDFEPFGQIVLVPDRPVSRVARRGKWMVRQRLHPRDGLAIEQPEPRPLVVKLIV